MARLKIAKQPGFWIPGTVVSSPDPEGVIRPQRGPEPRDDGQSGQRFVAIWFELSKPVDHETVERALDNAAWRTRITVELANELGIYVTGPEARP